MSNPSTPQNRRYPAWIVLLVAEMLALSESIPWEGAPVQADTADDWIVSSVERAIVKVSPEQRPEWADAEPEVRADRIRDVRHILTTLNSAPNGTPPVPDLSALCGAKSAVNPLLALLGRFALSGGGPLRVSALRDTLSGMLDRVANDLVRDGVATLDEQGVLRPTAA